MKTIKILKKCLFFIALLLSLGSGFASADDRLSSGLREQIREKDGEEVVEVIIRMNSVDESEVIGARGLLGKQGSINVLKKDAEDKQKILEEEDGESVNIVKPFWITNAVLAEVKVKDLERISSRSDVREVHENFQVFASEYSLAEETSLDLNSTEWSTTWGLERIGVTDIWDLEFMGSEEIKVAVLDTGVDTTHPDLQGRLAEGGWAEFDEFGSEVSSTPYDSDTHGTHVSGTVAGGSNSGDYIGVAPNTKLMHGLVLPEGTGTTAQVIAGMEWAVDNGADVVNMSLGGDGYYSVFEDPVNNMYNAGIAPVISIGNDGHGSVSSPGAIRNAFAVGASANDDSIAVFSGGGVVNDGVGDYIKPDFSAPGASVCSSVPGTGYSCWNGTSMAAPHIAGAIALILQVDNTLTVTDIFNALKETASYYETGSNLGEEKNTRYGYGIINVNDAIKYLYHIFTVPLESGDVTHNTVILQGEYSGTGEGSVFFKYKKTGDVEWISTATQTVSVGLFEQEVEDLEVDTEYQFKAVLSGVPDEEGQVLEFTTETAPTVSTFSVSEITSTSAKMTGEVTDMDGKLEVDVFFRYKKAGDAEWTETDLEQKTEVGSFEKTLTGLNDNQSYEYKAVVRWEEGGVFRYNTGSVDSFLTDDLPQVETGSVSDIDYDSAILHGEVTAVEGETVEAFFRYRRVGDAEWTETSKEEKTVIGSFQKTVTGLGNGESYEYKAIVQWGGTEEDTGSLESFSTVSHPGVVAVFPDDITYTSALLQGEVTEKGLETDVSAFFRYKEVGEVDWLATTTETISSVEVGSVFSEAIEGLTVESNYEVRAVVSWSGNENESSSLDFSTVGSPSVATSSPINIRSSSATLQGEVSEVGTESSVDLFFQYKKTGEVDWTKTTTQTLSDVEIGDSFSQNLEGLDENTSYDFKAVMEWGGSETAEGDVETFSTKIGTSSLALSEITVSPSTESYTNRDINFSIDLTNNSGESGSYIADFVVGGETVGSETKTIANGATETFSTTYSSESSGEYTVSVSEKTATFNLYDEPQATSVDVVVDYDSATLQGEVTDLVLEDEVDVLFHWRKGTVWNETTLSALTEVGSFESVVDELTTGETYHFRAVVQWEEGEETKQNEGETISFTTPNYPSVDTLSAEDISYASATLRGELTEIGGEDGVDVDFSYREEGSSGWSYTDLQTLSEEVVFSSAVTGLSSNTTYQYKVYMDWSGGSEEGEVIEFTTTDRPSPGGGGGGGGGSSPPQDDSDDEDDEEEEQEEEDSDEEVETESETVSFDDEALEEYKEQAEQKRKEVEELESKNNRLENIKKSAEVIIEALEESGDSELAEVVSGIISKAEELQEKIEEQLQEKEKELEEVEEKKEKIENFKRAERINETASSLLESIENEEIREILEEVITKTEEMKQKIQSN